jgi:hypothetical protein
MRTRSFAGFCLLLIGLGAPSAAVAEAPSVPDAAEAAFAAFQDQYGPGVRVWLDGRRDLLRPGERVRVLVRPEQDAYLAVFHIDTNGDVDILYPRSSMDDGWVRGGRTLALGSRGFGNYLRIRGGAGMGYVFAVALDEPLELWRVEELFGRRFASFDSRWTVYGDPFHAMDRIAHDVVPDGAWGYESTDHVSYHVGSRRYTHPRYACYDGYGDWYYGRGVYLSSCDRVRILLVARPHYYDTYYWRGSRRVYYERYYRPLPVRTVRAGPRQPEHGYKERTDTRSVPAAATYQRRPEPAARPGSAAGASRVGLQQQERARPQQQEGRAEPPARQRPQLQRRPPSDERPATRDERPSQREAPPAREARPPQRETPVRRDAPSARETAPRREAPPAREARPQQREAPPARQSAPAARESRPPPRQSAPARESAPRRESPPARESSPRGGDSSPAPSERSARVRPS